MLGPSLRIKKNESTPRPLWNLPLTAGRVHFKFNGFWWYIVFFFCIQIFIEHTRVVPESRRLFMLHENYEVCCYLILLVNSSIISALSCKI